MTGRGEPRLNEWTREYTLPQTTHAPCATTPSRLPRSLRTVARGLKGTRSPSSPPLCRSNSAAASIVAERKEERHALSRERWHREGQREPRTANIHAQSQSTINTESQSQTTSRLSQPSRPGRRQTQLPEDWNRGLRRPGNSQARRRREKRHQANKVPRGDKRDSPDRKQSEINGNEYDSATALDTSTKGLTDESAPRCSVTGHEEENRRLEEGAFEGLPAKDRSGSRRSRQADMSPEALQPQPAARSRPNLRCRHRHQNSAHRSRVFSRLTAAAYRQWC